MLTGLQVKGLQVYRLTCLQVYKFIGLQVLKIPNSNFLDLQAFMYTCNVKNSNFEVDIFIISAQIQPFYH